MVIPQRVDDARTKPRHGDRDGFRAIAGQQFPGTNIYRQFAERFVTAADRDRHRGGIRSRRTGPDRDWGNLRDGTAGADPQSADPIGQSVCPRADAAWRGYSPEPRRSDEWRFILRERTPAAIQ